MIFKHYVKLKTVANINDHMHVLMTHTHTQYTDYTLEHPMCTVNIEFKTQGCM